MKHCEIRKKIRKNKILVIATFFFSHQVFIGLLLNSSPNDKILRSSKLKAFLDGKINVTEKLKIVLGRVEKHCGKRRKCWSPAFSPFPTMFSKGFLYRVVKSRDCVVKS